jgi:predicted O-methyltransferase YrrM
VKAPREASWELAEGFVAEDPVFAAARGRGHELGCTPIGQGGGAALAFLAALTHARAVVEVGTGAGVSALWLLRGMAPDGVLTSIDVEGEHQRVARQALNEAGVATNRVRLINGRALDVMSRLADGAYDLVLVDGDKAEYGTYLEEALRLLRPGGVVAFDNALWHDKVADPSQRDGDTVALRQLVETVRTDERLTAVLLPVGDGLLAAVKRADQPE